MITSLTVNLKEKEFKLLEVRYTELRLLQRLRPLLMRKIFMFRVHFVYSLADYLFQELLGTLRLKGKDMVAIKTL